MTSRSGTTGAGPTTLELARAFVRSAHAWELTANATPMLRPWRWLGKRCRRDQKISGLARRQLINERAQHEFRLDRREAVGIGHRLLQAFPNEGRQAAMLFDRAAALLPAPSPWWKGIVSDVGLGAAGAGAAIALAQVTGPMARQIALTRPDAAFWTPPSILVLVILAVMTVVELKGGFLSRLGTLRRSAGAALACFCLALYGSGVIEQQRASGAHDSAHGRP